MEKSKKERIHKKLVEHINTFIAEEQMSYTEFSAVAGICRPYLWKILNFQSVPSDKLVRQIYESME